MPLQVSVDVVSETIRRRFTLFIIILVGVLAVGTTGYVIIKLYFEEYHSSGIELAVDAIYWTIITLTTLGSYPATVALTSVVGKVFTVVVVIMGIVLIIVAFPLALSPWFESRMKEIMSTTRVPLPKSNHVIIIGYSDVGKEVVSNLRNYEIDFLVIENNQAKVREMISDEVPAVIGDPTREVVLEKAHLDRAIAIISVEDDSVNAFVALTASRLRPDLRIVSSIQNIGNRTILKRAGTTQALAPKSTVGALLASEAVGRRKGELALPAQVLGDLSVGHFHVSGSSNVVGKGVGDVGFDSLQLMVVGVWRHGNFVVDPHGWTLKDGDIILLLGTGEQLEFVKNMF